MLPVWCLAIVAMLVMVLMAVRYADIVRWQIRAQNAADAAAQAVLALQTQQFNEMNSALYASAVEEYRIRTILYGLELTAYGNGGCSADSSCTVRYATLYNAYLKSAARYHDEIVLLNRITANMDATTMHNDATAVVAHLANPGVCGKTGGGDCAFSYALLDFSPRTPVYTVVKDARAFITPSYGDNMNVASGVNPSLLPAQTEVSVCADIPSPIPAFLNFKPKPFRVIARAAATAVMVEQDWFQPGQLNNAWTNNRYQPVETWSGSASNDGLNVDWYDTDFGGNSSQANSSYNGYVFGIDQDEFSAFTGWWNSVPMRPYSGTQPDSKLGCSG
ncbi:MAG TPA: pilus assembly protein TadG-related protein [Candidatus Elarobacter sp.]|nr:pilus assembly protein TadG-related protein [Candidatus Elarobacter sp.]